MTDTYPTKPDRTIGKGDRVRSYDFPGRTDCYVEGVVVRICDMEGCARYEILIQFRCLDGERVPKLNGAHAYPPVNGTGTTFGGICRGVVRVAE